MGKFEKITDEIADAKQFAWPQLEHVSAVQVALQARSTKMTQTSTINVKDRAFQLSRCTSINLDKLFCRAVLEVGNHRLVVFFVPEMLEDLLTHGNLEMIGVLVPETAAIVAEHLLLDFVTLFEGAFGTSCSVKLFQLETMELSLSDRSTPKICYKLDSKSNDDTPHELFVAGDPDLLFRVAKYSEVPIENKNMRETPHDINVQICHFGCDIVLARAEFDALCVGDGLVIEQTWGQRFDGRISIGGFRVGPVKQRRQNLVLTETPMLQILKELTPKGGLDMPLQNREKATELGHSAYDDMPVQLSLQLAKHSLPLSKVGDLKKGDIVPFETLVSNEVRVFANGDIFAEAELVELNGKFAVRILEMRV